MAINILIIDDDKAVVESTADMLKSFEFNVITATDGKKGFELADIVNFAIGVLSCPFSILFLIFSLISIFL